MSNSIPLNEIDTDVNEIENDSPLCSDSKIDAIVTVKDNSTYVFKGKQYYKLTDDNIEQGTVVIGLQKRFSKFSFQAIVRLVTIKGNANFIKIDQFKP